MSPKQQDEVIAFLKRLTKTQYTRDSEGYEQLLREPIVEEATALLADIAATVAAAL